MAKLRHRWVNFEPRIDQVGGAKEKVTSLFCNNKHIFCGEGSGLVRVYTVASGEYVRDLVPRDSPSSTTTTTTLVAGGKEVVAAVTWDEIVSVWSTGGDMDWVASYQYQCEGCQKKPCDCGGEASGTCGIEDIKVTPHGKIVLRTLNRSPLSATASSVLIMKKGEDGWTVDDSPMLNRCGFAMDGNVKLGCHGDYSFCASLEATTTDFPLGQQRTTSRTGLAIPTTIKGWNLREQKHWELTVSCWSRPSSYLSTETLETLKP